MSLTALLTKIEDTKMNAAVNQQDAAPAAPAAPAAVTTATDPKIAKAVALLAIAKPADRGIASKLLAESGVTGSGMFFSNVYKQYFADTGIEIPYTKFGLERKAKREAAAAKKKQAIADGTIADTGVGEGVGGPTKTKQAVDLLLKNEATIQNTRFAWDILKEAKMTFGGSFFNGVIKGYEDFINDRDKAADGTPGTFKLGKSAEGQARDAQRAADKAAEDAGQSQ